MGRGRERKVVIPRARRESLGLLADRANDARDRDGRVELEPAATPMRLRRRKGRLVAVPDVELPTLTDELVRATLDRTRR